MLWVQVIRLAVVVSWRKVCLHSCSVSPIHCYNHSKLTDDIVIINDKNNAVHSYLFIYLIWIRRKLPHLQNGKSKANEFYVSDYVERLPIWSCIESMYYINNTTAYFRLYTLMVMKSKMKILQF